ncbi:MAG: cryptochrome/photolyase family protein, partial [Burkholderiales bacterium]|nr:cryptochrome/photolyase family protein [Burkholderiales bacterium]
HKQWLMERFYRQMRTRHDVLMAGGKPLGGRWNFDHDNRKPWPGLPREPADPRVRHDHSALWQRIKATDVKHFGNPAADRLAWPLNRAEALAQLEDFVAEALPHFGDFQDALSSRAWRLFHSLLSFALNTKMLGPREVVQRVEAAHAKGEVPLAAAEGFIRQIIGWREYVRGVYWAHMPGYVDHNVFGHHTPLPAWFWTGKTRMRCLAHSIGQSLEHAYAHHIQRLMVIGNFALLAGLAPAEVHRWYLGIYIDAFEWVELPNTLGMSQYADGGLMASKPYVATGRYIQRMGGGCAGCRYDPGQRVGERACPYTTLYWDFLMRHEAMLARQPRMALHVRNLVRLGADERQAVRARADAIRAGEVGVA